MAKEFATKPYLREVRLERDRIADFDDYPFSIPAVKQLRELTFHPDVTFFIGENGSGKSTLIEAIAIAMGFGAEGWTKNMRLDSAKDVSKLHEY